MSLCFYFCFLWTKPTSYPVFKMAGKASSRPAHSWVGFWKTGRKQPIRSLMGLPHKEVTQIKSPCVGLIKCLGSREWGKGRAGTVKTQPSEVSEVTGRSSSGTGTVSIHTGHRQLRPSSTEAAGDFGVRLVSISSIPCPCEGLGRRTGLALFLLPLVWGPVGEVY